MWYKNAVSEIPGPPYAWTEGKDDTTLDKYGIQALNGIPTSSSGAKEVLAEDACE